MWYETLFEQIENMADNSQALKMSAYMKNKFPFLGIPKPALKNSIKPYLQKSKKLEFDWDFVMLCWQKEYREAQYIGVEYILLNQKKLTSQDLDQIKYLITHKSWWETTDSLDSVVGKIILEDPSKKQEILDWSVSDNLWLRRTAIDHQQKLKEKTDTELLSKIILNNLGSGEFFIDKAIGWSLRDYKKVNATWVDEFLKKHDSELSMLSKKEANK